jgi:hypothetical protein
MDSSVKPARFMPFDQIIPAAARRLQILEAEMSRQRRAPQQTDQRAFLVGEIDRFEIHASTAPA